MTTPIGPADINEIQRVSKMTLVAQRKNLKWLFCQDELIQLEALKIQSSIIKAETRNRAHPFSMEMVLGALAAACEILRKIQNGKHKKNFDPTDRAEYERQEQLRLLMLRQRKKRDKPKEDGMFAKKELLLKLRDKDKLSFRKIAAYFEQYEKQKVSSEYLRQMYKKLTE